MAAPQYLVGVGERSGNGSWVNKEAAGLTASVSPLRPHLQMVSISSEEGVCL